MTGRPDFQNCAACELPRSCQGVRQCAKGHRPRDPNSMRSRVEADIAQHGPSTVDEVTARLGCEREDASRALRSLRRDERLQITQPGAFRGRNGRDPSVYAIATPGQPVRKAMLSSVFDLGRGASMKRRRPQSQMPTYSLLDEMAASPVHPLPEQIRTHQLTRMWQGLVAIETHPNPTTNDWRVLSDAVNLMETLVTLGEVEDASGLLQDAVTALALAGRRHMKEGHPIRLDALGIQAVRSVLEDYAAVLEQLPARTMVRCHRRTERRIREIMAGKRLPHDVEIVDL